MARWAGAAACRASSLRCWRRRCGNSAERRRPWTSSPTGSTCSTARRRRSRCGWPTARLRGAAVAAGAEHRALGLLETLQAIGQLRRLPRLEVASLSEQVRLHAHRDRAQACADLCRCLHERLVDAPPARPRWWQAVGFLAGQAHAHAAIAAHDWRTAADLLAAADDQARRLRVTPVHVELLGLRAFVLDRCGETSWTLLREAVELAQVFHLRQVLVDAHPGVRGLMAAMPGAAGGSGPSSVAPSPSGALRAAGGVRDLRVPVAPWGGLTGKEREILGLLSRNLSNKEIGRALQSSETTVKWHVKNLFAKLDAGTRKAVVHRARLLGMLPQVD